VVPDLGRNDYGALLIVLSTVTQCVFADVGDVPGDNTVARTAAPV